MGYIDTMISRAFRMTYNSKNYLFRYILIQEAIYSVMEFYFGAFVKISSANPADTTGRLKREWKSS